MSNEDAVREWAKAQGYRVAFGPVAVLDEVRRVFERRLESGEIEARFYEENLAGFTYLEGVSLKNPRSVVLVAIPKPAHILVFTVGDKKVETILPPTYVRYRGTFAEVRDDLAATLARPGFHVELLNAPLKALANRLGLLSYGRNNVGYIEGLGSFFQLVGFVSDMPLAKGSRSPRPAETLLARCQKCRVCAAACPTGAIEKERVLLHAEKCYTLFSESPNPIPEALKPPSPKCLIGCLRCQELCPENKGLLRYENAAVSFDADETAAFLGIKPAADGPAFDRAGAKFRELGMTEGFPVFRRNLTRLLKLQGTFPKGTP
jgi:epoxyqueuosine reductase